MAAANYSEACLNNALLPKEQPLPSLERYLEEDRGGVVMLEGSELVAFYAWENPMQQQFGLSPGIWSPLHAHATIPERREYLYDRLYQEVADIMVAQGVFSSAVTLYCHDEEAVQSFFNNGFGNRCIDSIRETKPLRVSSETQIDCRLASADDAVEIVTMNNELVDHLNSTPLFMSYRRVFTKDEMRHWIAEDDYYTFAVATYKGRVIAYIRLQDEGENFIGDSGSMHHISGAYTLPVYRGTGVSALLLDWVLAWMRERQYTLCGVDYESINYTARRFWGKYFMPYTYSLVRRIDERTAERG